MANYRKKYENILSNLDYSGLNEEEIKILEGAKWICNNMIESIESITEKVNTDISDREKADLYMERSVISDVVNISLDALQKHVKKEPPSKEIINVPKETDKEVTPLRAKRVSLIDDDEVDLEELKKELTKNVVSKDIISSCLEAETVAMELLSLMNIWSKKYDEFYRKQEQLFILCGIDRKNRSADDFETLYKTYPDFMNEATQFIYIKDEQIKDFVSNRSDDIMKYVVVMLSAGRAISKNNYVLNENTYKDDLATLLNNELNVYNKASKETGDVYENFYGNAYNIFHKEIPGNLINWLKTGIRVVKNSERI